MIDLTRIFADDEQLELLEADFISEYNIDIRDVWRRGSGLTLRKCINLIKRLPDHSRFKRHLAEDNGLLDIKEQLLFALVDTLRQNVYWSHITAIKDIKQSNRSKLYNKAPKPLERPSIKPRPKFSSPQEIAHVLGKLGKFSVRQ